MDEELEETIETTRKAVLVVWDEESQDVETDNIHDLPAPMVLGMLQIAAKRWAEELEWEDIEED